MPPISQLRVVMGPLGGVLPGAQALSWPAWARGSPAAGCLATTTHLRLVQPPSPPRIRDSDEPFSLGDSEGRRRGPRACSLCLPWEGAIL